MEVVDRKFKFVAVNPCNGKVYTEENAVVFCAKDRALVAAIEAYISSAGFFGAADEHLESMGLLLGRVNEYQRTIECRVPDTETDCEIDRCIGGKGL